MQIADQKTQVDAKTAQGWLQDYLEDEEGVEPSAAENWAKGFLRYAHEHSGLFVEQEGPGMYVFTHEGFREYLAARELHDLGEYTFIQTLLDKILDDSWEQVILLAAAYKGYSRRARRDLIDKALQKVENLRKTGDDNWLRCLVMTGKMTGDMDKYLPVPKRMQVESELRATMIAADLSPETRATAADTLDELGYLPDDLHIFVPIPNEPSPTFHIARYQVTNIQYQRFLDANDFAKKEYWIDFPKFSGPDKGTSDIKLIGDWGEEGWQWLRGALQDEDKSPDGKVVLPRYWNDPRFGISRKGVPVVRITWYEANAYCKWLLAHWDELSEAEENPGLKPTLIRLPTEREWALAAGGEKPENRYPWDKNDQVTEKEEEILRRANVDESDIGRTTPVAMYPLGVSPHGVWDMGGNVWEWQANYYDNDRDWLALGGGSWSYLLRLARVSGRNGDFPVNPWYYSGFRLCVPPS
jgi:formylglycine-generating enzyme required for sulfatase activity